MSYKELIEELIKRMKEVGYDPSSTFIKILLKEYEDLLIGNNQSSILLRSIVSRLRSLPDNDRCVWLKSIINEFDEELSHAKWKEGYEQGKFEGSLEPKKYLPEIPSMVADWIEDCKLKEKSLLKSLLYTPTGINSWVDNSENQETFVKAWLFGYEIKKDKKYLIKFKGISDDQCYLNCINNNDKTKEWILYDELEYPNIVTKHTREELEQSGFEWVFDCPGVEIIEVVE